MKTKTAKTKTTKRPTAKRASRTTSKAVAAKAARALARKESTPDERAVAASALAQAVAQAEVSADEANARLGELESANSALSAEIRRQQESLTTALAEVDQLKARLAAVSVGGGHPDERDQQIADLTTQLNDVSVRAEQAVRQASEQAAWAARQGR